MASGAEALDRSASDERSHPPKSISRDGAIRFVGAMLLLIVISGERNFARGACRNDRDYSAREGSSDSRYVPAQMRVTQGQQFAEQSKNVHPYLGSRRKLRVHVN